MELAGKRILVVEDDHYIADEICQDLRSEGATVLGPAPTPFYAMQLLGRRGVDGAVLDVRLHGMTVFGLADELTRRGTPMVFATGYGDDVIPERFRGMPRVTKPYDRALLIEALRDMARERLPDMPPERSVAPRAEAKQTTSAVPRVQMMRAISTSLRRRRAVMPHGESSRRSA